MARSNERSTRRSPKDPARGDARRSPCALCRDKMEWVDYKDVAMLRRYMSDRGKIRARQVTGNCVRHQGEVAVAIKTARELVLLPRGDTNTQTTHTQQRRSPSRWRAQPGVVGHEGPAAK